MFWRVRKILSHCKSNLYDSFWGKTMSLKENENLPLQEKENTKLQLPITTHIWVPDSPPEDHIQRHVYWDLNHTFPFT